MDTDLYYQPESPLLAGKDFSSRNLRALGALRGFAVNPGLDFHREGAKHAKKTRRTLVYLRLCCSMFMCVYLWFRSQLWLRLFHTLAQLVQVDLADARNAGCQCWVRVRGSGKPQRDQGRTEIISHLLNVYRRNRNPRQIGIGPRSRSEPRACADCVHSPPHLAKMHRPDFRKP